MSDLSNPTIMDSKNIEKIVTEAKKVFLRYGFRRATMADLAKGAQMSRPALYLVFPSKEDVFRAVVVRSIGESLEEIRTGIPRLKTTRERLTFAFEVWYVRTFEMIRASPDAGDLFESSCEVACEPLAKAHADFVAIVTEILKTPVREQSRIKLPAARIAEILCGAAHGFKKNAEDATELRRILNDHLTLVLAALQDSSERT
jgi:AcrR family transcriptional regulator